MAKNFAQLDGLAEALARANTSMRRFGVTVAQAARQLHQATHGLQVMTNAEAHAICSCLAEVPASALRRAAGHAPSFGEQLAVLADHGFPEPCVLLLSKSLPWSFPFEDLLGVFADERVDKVERQRAGLTFLRLNGVIK